MKKKVAVIGLGYVGLPLAMLAEKRGYPVIGIDSSAQKIKLLNEKVSPIDDTETKKLLADTTIKFTSKFDSLGNIDIAIICVPTPVDSQKNPDLSMVKSAAVSAASHLKPGSLLIIESTINPGVCDEVIIPEIESQTNHKVGKTLYLAHCPERINPGDKKWHVGNISRVVGGFDSTSLNMAVDFYSSIISAEIKRMNTLKEAEAVKIVENSFRDINIAFVNELAMSFNRLGIDVTNVINGAATKPFAFMPHYPGIGVGGHCIPVDPYYLIEYARENGFEHHFLSLARTINENMPIYSIDTIEKKLIEAGLGSLEGKRVCILGLSYKPNVGDDRESPSKIVVGELTRRHSIITTYDPYFLEKSIAKSLVEAISEKDVVILVTAHDEFSKIDFSLLKSGCVFFDGRNAFTSAVAKLNNKDFIYIGI